MHCVALTMHEDTYLKRSYQGEMQLSSAGHIVPAGANRPLSVPPHRSSAANWEGLIRGQVTDDGATLATQVGLQPLIKAQRYTPFCSEA